MSNSIANSNGTPFPDPLIRSCLQPFGVELDVWRLEQVRRFADLLLRWNQKVNLTSITEPTEILIRHFGESMFAAAAVPIDFGELLDIGSGGGFPALPLKILRSELSVHLVESDRRKAAFLKEVRRHLSLDGTEVIRSRFSECHFEHLVFDYVTVRAIGGIERVIERAQPLLKNSGKIVVWVGQDDANRILRTSGWRWAMPISIPESKRRVLLWGSPFF